MQGSNHIISTKRLVTTSGKAAYGVSSILSDVEAWIEQMEIEAALNWSGDSSMQIYLMHLSDLPDIKTSDKVIDEDGTEYFVKNVQPFKGGDIPSHTEVVLSAQAIKV